MIIGKCVVHWVPATQYTTHDPPAEALLPPSTVFGSQTQSPYYAANLVSSTSSSGCRTPTGPRILHRRNQRFLKMTDASPSEIFQEGENFRDWKQPTFATSRAIGLVSASDLVAAA